ncbi:MAG: M20 family metallo-hydrolase [Chitinophagaceae bacterium]
MNNKSIHDLQQEAISLLKQLISTSSFSKEEQNTARVIEYFFRNKGIARYRFINNVWAYNTHFDPLKPTIILNSHHDTVKPNSGYTKDPFSPIVENGKLYGLGSNDAGGSLVSLIATFLHFSDREDLRYNLIIAATAEEEISGPNGIEALLVNEQFNYPFHNKGIIAGAIVGEPTQMQMAVAERGLMVLDCKAHGQAGHAARNEGDNAVYKAIKDIDWFSTYRFEKVSDLLGPVKMTVTSVNTENKAHNVVPSECSFIVDTRINELYAFEEVLDTIRSNVQCDVKPRSTRMRSTAIALEHALVKAGLELGRTYYGSPTTSDKALMPFPALKMGPGDSARSHTADEFIYLDEIKQGIDLYVQLLNQLL